MFNKKSISFCPLKNATPIIVLSWLKKACSEHRRDANKTRSNQLTQPTALFK